MTATNFDQISPDIDWSNFNSTVLIEVTRPQGVFTSSGVAINKDTILTAAHCLQGEVIKVRVSFSVTYNAKGKFILGKSFEIHPEYNSADSNYHCDLAKIRLATSLPEGTNYYSVMKNDRNISGNFVRIGFGARNEINARTLVKPIFKNVSAPTKTLELFDMYSFSGDSGGPIFLQQNGQVYLVAIHSTLSSGPEGKSSFNPLLAAHRSWIYG